MDDYNSLDSLEVAYDEYSNSVILSEFVSGNTSIQSSFPDKLFDHSLK